MAQPGRQLEGPGHERRLAVLKTRFRVASADRGSTAWLPRFKRSNKTALMLPPSERDHAVTELEPAARANGKRRVLKLHFGLQIVVTVLVAGGVGLIIDLLLR